MWAGPGANCGGSILVYNASRPKAQHDGGSVFSLTVPVPSDTNIQSQVNDYLLGVGETDFSGTGCLVAKRNSGSASEFGAVANTSDDQWQSFENCKVATGKVILDAGVYHTTKSINQTDKLEVIGAGVDITILKALSPTADDRFGSSGAMVYSVGAKGSPIFGSMVFGITIDCSDLVNKVGGVGLKGKKFERVHGFLVERVKIINCASYGYWCLDETIEDGGNTYTSGIYENCEAIDCSISFEQVNTRGVTLSNCRARLTGRSLPFPVLSMFHPYGGENMGLVYENCSGVGDCSAIVDILGTCKGVKIIGSRFEQLNASNSALFMSPTSSEYDNIEFVGVEILSEGSGAQLSVGENGTATNTIKFTSSKIVGKAGNGAQINSGVVGGTFTFTDTDTKGVARNELTIPFGLYDNGGTATVRYMGGSCVAAGSTANVSPTNKGSDIFFGTAITPKISSQSKIVQQVNGQTVLVDENGYGIANILFPRGVSDFSKVTLSAHVRFVDTGNGQDATDVARAISWANLDDQVVRLYASDGGGLTVSYSLTEWSE